MPKPKRLFLSLAMILAIATTGTVLADESSGLKPGKVALQSIGALEISDDGILFVGDSQGGAVYALDVDPPAASSTGPLETLSDLDEKIAAMLGTGARDIKVEDMVVHEPSGTVYLSITRGRGEAAAPVLVQIARGGKISLVDLGNIPHARLELDNAPAADAKMYAWKSRTLTITDLELIDGELFIAGLSNEEFASTLRRTPFPFAGKAATTGLEIYHGAHGAYETFAPIFSFIPLVLNDQQQLLAGYLCTPLVTFPLDEIREKHQLRGKTIAELGWGNIPIDMVPYRKDGEDYLLIVNTRRGNMRLKTSEIAAAQKRDGITTEVGPRTGIEDHTLALGIIAQADTFDSDHIAILGRSIDNGSLYLGTTPKAGL